MSYLNTSGAVKLGGSYTVAYLITLVACSRTLGGIVMPSCLAVLRLKTSSNFFG